MDQKREPDCGRRIVEAVTALVDLLGEFPRMGVGTDEPGVSMFPLVRYRYLIYYKVLEGGEVRIIRIRHASRKRPT
jgi:plasmid stabilization system protein ParE